MRESWERNLCVQCYMNRSLIQKQTMQCKYGPGKRVDEPEVNQMQYEGRRNNILSSELPDPGRSLEQKQYAYAIELGLAVKETEICASPCDVLSQELMGLCIFLVCFA